MYKLMHSVRAYKMIFAVLERRWLIQPVPALGMFEVFGRTGPPILGGPPFLDAKKFRINYVGI